MMGSVVGFDILNHSFLSELVREDFDFVKICVILLVGYFLVSFQSNPDSTDKFLLHCLFVPFLPESNWRNISRDIG